MAHTCWEANRLWRGSSVFKDNEGPWGPLTGRTSKVVLICPSEFSGLKTEVIWNSKNNFITNKSNDLNNLVTFEYKSTFLQCICLLVYFQYLIPMRTLNLPVYFIHLKVPLNRRLDTIATYLTHFGQWAIQLHKECNGYYLRRLHFSSDKLRVLGAPKFHITPLASVWNCCFWTSAVFLSKTRFSTKLLIWLHSFNFRFLELNIMPTVTTKEIYSWRKVQINGTCK